MVFSRFNLEVGESTDLDHETLWIKLRPGLDCEYLQNNPESLETSRRLDPQRSSFVPCHNGNGNSIEALGFDILETRLKTVPDINVLAGITDSLLDEVLQDPRERGHKARG